MQSRSDDGFVAAVRGGEERTADLARALVRTSADGILAFDRALSITVWNPGMEQIFGVDAGDAVGRGVFDVLPCFLEDGEASRFRATLDGVANVSAGRPFAVRSSGCSGVVDCRYTPVRDGAGAPRGGLAVFRDRTRSVDVVAALREARDLFTGLFENAAIGVAVIELDPVHGGELLRVNQALCDITGLAAADLAGSTIASLLHSHAAEDAVDAVRRLLRGETARHEVRTLVRRRDGTARPAAMRISPVPGPWGSGEYGIVQVQALITSADDQQSHDHRARPRAGDGRTLSTRGRFEAALGGLVADAARHGDTGALVVVDVHDLGLVTAPGRKPRALRSIAEVLCGRTRVSDLVCRLGGGQFAVLLRAVDSSGAETVARRLLRRIAGESAWTEAAGRRLTDPRAGVAAVDASSGSPEDIVSLARARAAVSEARITAPGIGLAGPRAIAAEPA